MIFAMIASPVMAKGLDNQSFVAKVFDTEIGKPMQLAELSAQEMRETEGEAIPLALMVAGSGAFSAWKYHYDVYKATGHIGSAGGAARAAALGSGISAASGGLGAAAGGGLAGTAAWAPGMFSLNQGVQRANTAHTINNR